MDNLPQNQQPFGGIHHFESNPFINPPFLLLKFLFYMVYMTEILIVRKTWQNLISSMCSFTGKLCSIATQKKMPKSRIQQNISPLHHYTPNLLVNLLFFSRQLRYRIGKIPRWYFMVILLCRHPCYIPTISSSVRSCVSPTATSELPTFQFHQGHGSHSTLW